MRKSASDFSTVGENKNKTNKLHLATCYLNRSQLQFCFFFRFLFCQVLELQMDTSIYLYRSGSHWAGEKEPGRHSLGRPIQAQIPPGSTGKVATVWCLPSVDHRPACCEGDAARSTNETRGEGALRHVSGRGDTNWLLIGRSDAAGASLTPGLAPWCNRHPFGAQEVKNIPSFILRNYVCYLVLLRGVMVLCWWWGLEERRKMGRLPALRLPHSGSPTGRSWLSISGNHYFKRLIKMPDPQGPLTYRSIFVCIMKGEQLLDLAIRENVLKSKIYK